MVRDYTTDEAAANLGVTRVAIYKAIERGKLLSYKRGQTILIDKKELDRWNKIRRKRS